MLCYRLKSTFWNGNVTGLRVPLQNGNVTGLRVPFEMVMLQV